MLLFGKVFRHFFTITFKEQVKIEKGGEKKVFFFSSHDITDHDQFKVALHLGWITNKKNVHLYKVQEVWGFYKRMC